ncbi:Ig-like domain-containing protein [Actinoplanes sp. DH11]|uniref:Ig-like domain-containing protein n=1 Tax=Actinoplanes sp. DH11 TaxID=2857011 RepID=UPI001E345C29|nr:Ig-like domain-containing protein [Actinoplanes sp. DH11]
MSADTVSITSTQGHVVKSAPWTFTWDVRPYANSYEPIHLRVADRAGNETTYGQGYYVDGAGPTANFQSFPGVVGRGRTALNAYALDRSGVDRTEWWVDGVRRGSGEQYVHDFGIRGRTARVTFKAYDEVGNVTSITRNVIVDVTGPAVTWVSPKPGAVVRGPEVTTSFRAVDANTESVVVLDRSRGAVMTCKPVCTLVRKLADGKREIRWTVEDRLGNRTTARRTVVVDSTRPQLKVTKAPKNKAKVKGTVKVTASASDKNGVARVELLVNGKVVAKDAKAAYKFSVNTKKYGKKIKVQLRAYDKAGNVTKTSTRTWYRR